MARMNAQKRVPLFRINPVTPNKPRLISTSSFTLPYVSCVDKLRGGSPTTPAPSTLPKQYIPGLWQFVERSRQFILMKFTTIINLITSNHGFRIVSCWMEPANSAFSPSHGTLCLVGFVNSLIAIIGYVLRYWGQVSCGPPACKPPGVRSSWLGYYNIQYISANHSLVITYRKEGSGSVLDLTVISPSLVRDISWSVSEQYTHALVPLVRST